MERTLRHHCSNRGGVRTLRGGAAGGVAGDAGIRIVAVAVIIALSAINYVPLKRPRTARAFVLATVAGLFALAGGRL